MNNENLPSTKKDIKRLEKLIDSNREDIEAIGETVLENRGNIVEIKKTMVTKKEFNEKFDHLYNLLKEDKEKQRKRFEKLEEGTDIIQKHIGLKPSEI